MIGLYLLFGPAIVEFCMKFLFVCQKDLVDLAGVTECLPNSLTLFYLFVGGIKELDLIWILRFNTILQDLNCKIFFLAFCYMMSS